MSNADTRPRLIDLWVQVRFRSDELAEKAGVSEDVIFCSGVTDKKVFATLLFLLHVCASFPSPLSLMLEVQYK
jgi:hypothetical protein